MISLKSEKLLIDDSVNSAMQRDGTAAFDCLALPDKFSGAAYYIYHLTRAVLQTNRSFHVAVICRPIHADLFSALLLPGDKLITPRLSNRFERLFFYEFRLKPLLKKHAIGLFYAMHYITPPHSRDYSIINTVHDLGFLLHPNYYPMIKRLYFGSRLPLFLKRSDLISAISLSTAESLKKLFPQYADRVVVNVPGTDHLILEDVSAGIVDERPPFFLAVNTFEKRKNIPFLVRVFNRLKQQYSMPHQLVLVGQRANGAADVYREVENSPYSEDILLPDWVEEDTLANYYRDCDAFLNASFYEGFGFTPLEAIRYQRPVFLYKNTTANEFLGNQKTIFSHLNADSWAESIFAAWKNGYPERISPDSFLSHTWQKSATEAVHQIEHLMKKDEIRVSK